MDSSHDATTTEKRQHMVSSTCNRRLRTIGVVYMLCSTTDVLYRSAFGYPPDRTLFTEWVPLLMYTLLLVAATYPSTHSISRHGKRKYSRVLAIIPCAFVAGREHVRSAYKNSTSTTTLLVMFGSVVIPLVIAASINMFETAESLDVLRRHDPDVRLVFRNRGVVVFIQTPTVRMPIRRRKQVVKKIHVFPALKCGDTFL